LPKKSLYTSNVIILVMANVSIINLDKLNLNEKMQFLQQKLNMKTRTKVIAKCIDIAYDTLSKV